MNSDRLRCGCVDRCEGHVATPAPQATSSEPVCINPDHFEGIFICAVDRLEFGVEGAETPVGEP